MVVVRSPHQCMARSHLVLSSYRGFVFLCEAGLFCVFEALSGPQPGYRPWSATIYGSILKESSFRKPH